MLILLPTGRERTTSPDTLEARFHPRTNLCPRRINSQIILTIFHHQPPAKVLPHARKPKFQYCEEYGEQDFQIQHG
jgi:hypothetical protein